MSLWFPMSRRSCSSGWPFADRQRNALCLAAAAQSKGDLLAYAVRSKRAQERSHMTNGPTVPCDDDIALVHACLGSWPLRLDLHHHDTPCAALDRNKLEAEAEIAPRDVPVLLKARCDTLNSGRWNHQHSSARSEHCHADRPTRRVNGKAAFRILPHAQIKFDRALISPPRRHHHGPVLRDTMPNAAVGAPSSAPTAIASVPTGTASVSSAIAGRSERSIRNTAMSVV
jgi:hypothetical protein